MNSIYLNENGKLNELKSVTYDLEADLQKIISDNPELLLGGTTDTSRKYKLIADEKGIPAIVDGSDRWQVDHLFVDNNAVLTFVEDKRSTDTRIRREVVGQALEYAANAVKHWDINSIRKMYEANNADIFGYTGEKADKFWEEVHKNAKNGKIRVIFVADEIPLSLRNIIDFLNSITKSTEFLGLEVKKYKTSGGDEVYTSEIICENTPESIEISDTHVKWDYNTFLDDVYKWSDTDMKTLSDKIIKDFTDEGCRMWYGEGKTHASVVVIYDNINKEKHHLFKVAPLKSYVAIEIYFKHFKKPYETTDKRAEIAAKLNDIFETEIPETNLSKYQILHLDKLLDESKYEAFKKVMFEIIDDYKKNDE